MGAPAMPLWWWMAHVPAEAAALAVAVAPLLRWPLRLRKPLSSQVAIKALSLE